jgi:hypothetical protein
VTPSNWDIYGYGAPGYSKIVKVALEAHRDAGILFDYAHSANRCVPAKKGNPGLSWQLVRSDIISHVCIQLCSGIDLV